MKPTSSYIQRLYLFLTLLNTLATSFIWGINTLFLLDAGLNNAQAFAANAFFTVGQVIFEVPTGVVADSWGRRASYILGTLTLAASTLMYLWAWQIHAPFVYWALSSVLLGLGYTFFSGATEAWLVDALDFAGYKQDMDSVFAKGQIVSGGAMLAGSVAGGFIAQVSTLGVPYILRALVLGMNFLAALFLMKDWGFTPRRGTSVISDIREILGTSVNLGIRNRPVRWVMLAGPFGAGVGFYTFYAMQPHLLNLYGDKSAYGVAGLAAAIVACAQIAGGFAVPYVRRVFMKRTSVLAGGIIMSTVLLLLLGTTSSFAVAIGIMVVWGLVFSAVMPVRQAYLNNLIPSAQRATVLSFDSLVSSSGGVVIQPALGKAADVWSYPVSFLGGAAFQVLALPFMLLAAKENASADEIRVK